MRSPGSSRIASRDVCRGVDKHPSAMAGHGAANLPSRVHPGLTIRVVGDWTTLLGDQLHITTWTRVSNNPSLLATPTRNCRGNIEVR